MWHTFLDPRGWTSIRALVDNFPPFSLQFPRKKGVDLYLERFFGGSGGGVLLGHGTNKGGVDLYFFVVVKILWVKLFVLGVL